MPTAPPAGWYLDPDSSGGQRYWDGEHWSKHRRAQRPAPLSGMAALATGLSRRWDALPAVVRIVIAAALVLALIGIGVILGKTPSHDDWAQLPGRLTCRIQDGPTPPDNITVSSVEVKHPRGSVLQLVVRFAKPLPASPTATHATSGFVGYVLNYHVATNGKNFADLGPDADTDDLAITSTLAANGSDARMRADRDTNARRTAPDTVQILLDLGRLGIGNQPVRPQLTLESQFNTPSITTVQFATQVCGE